MEEKKQLKISLTTAIVLVVILLFFLLVLILFCRLNIKENYNQINYNNSINNIRLNKSEYKYKIIYDGYISDFDTMIISNINEFNDFMSDAGEWNKKYKQKISSNKYNEKYFTDKSIALISITIGSSMNKFKGVKVSNDGSILIVKPNIKYASGTTTDDITGKLILVEIDKDIAQIKLEYIRN